MLNIMKEQDKIYKTKIHFSIALGFSFSLTDNTVRGCYILTYILS